MRHEWTMIDHITEVAEFDTDGGVAAVEFRSFPRWAAIHTKFLFTADRRFVQPDEGGVTLRGRNGEARYEYREMHEQPDRKIVLCERVAGGIGEFLPDPLSHPLSPALEARNG